MNNSYKAVELQPDKEMLLAKRLQKIIKTERLDAEREAIKSAATELGVEVLECAAALLRLMQPVVKVEQPSENKPSIQPGIKMVRYRLDVGSNHHITVEELKKILVEESGVDKNNINNVSIHGLYTLIELPDAMPPDIFQHLKLVEINHRKLDIRRVKTRNHKKRGNMHKRRNRQYNPKSGQATSDQASGEVI